MWVDLCRGRKVLIDSNVRKRVHFFVNLLYDYIEVKKLKLMTKYLWYGYRDTGLPR